MVKEEVLKLLQQNKGNRVSGGEIGRKLNVSRTAVWKAVNTLKNEGHIIVSHPNGGYVLSEKSDILSQIEIWKNLRTKLFGKELEVLKSVDSTNNYVKEKAEKGEAEGLVVLAEQQEKGKGRLGREFISPDKKGIYMSILLRPKIVPADMNFITILSAVAVYNAIEKLCGFTPEIKWVNDILYRGKKLCGILTEGVIQGETGNVDYVVVGIGINVSGNEESLPPEIRDIAQTLEACSGKKILRNTLVSAILNEFEQKYSALTTNNGKIALIKSYKEKLCMLNEEVIVSQGVSKYNAIALDVDKDGHLLIRNESGEVLTLSAGEVSIKPKKKYFKNTRYA